MAFSVSFTDLPGSECDTQTLSMDIQTIEEEDETQVDTLPSSITRTIHRSEHIPRRQLSNQKQDR